MNSGRTVNTTVVQHDHQSGSQVTLSIELPQNVDMCSLVVTIRAGNSAGMSSPTEIQVGRCSCFHAVNHNKLKSWAVLLSLHAECPTISTESTSATSFGTDGISSVVTGALSSVVSEAKQGDNITTIGISYVIVAAWSIKLAVIKIATKLYMIVFSLVHGLIWQQIMFLPL